MRRALGMTSGHNCDMSSASLQYLLERSRLYSSDSLVEPIQDSNGGEGWHQSLRL